MSEKALISSLSRLSMCDLLSVIREIGDDLPDDVREAVIQLAAERLFKEACAHDVLAALDDQAGSGMSKIRRYFDERIMPEVFAGQHR